MELKVMEYQIPEVIKFNFEELKQELTEKTKMYEMMVYTDNQVQEAKKDKANLNKLKKALNEERIRLEREYMQPFNEFKKQIAEIIAIIDKPVAVIDEQVKAFEEDKKQKKFAEIKAFWEETEHPDWMKLPQIYEETWLNASTSMKSIQVAIQGRISQAAADIQTLSNMPEFAFEAVEIYKSTFDMNKAISEGHRLSEIQKQKAAYEAEQAKKNAEAEFAKAMNPPAEEKAEEPAEMHKTWVKFAAHMTVEQARMLKKFFDDNAIDYKAI